MSITQYNSSVRQMSQSKFNAMKNASGKIPDLANQIVMTNSEDTNTSCLRTEVVYDMTSSDANINWGYPNGIQGGITISGKNFIKYERLRVYAYTDWYKQSFEISTEVSSIYGKMNTQSPDANNHNSTYIKMNIVNDGFDISFYSVVIPSGSSAWTLMNGNSNYYIYKIEGILKTPSMIYTGDELTAGNGISIENGVISGIKSEVVWSGAFAYLANEQTMNLDLSKYKYVEFMTSIGNILPMNLQDTRPNGDLYVYLNASSYYDGSWHDGVKCEGTYYYGTKQIKWSGNYCGLTQVRGYWW